MQSVMDIQNRDSISLGGNIPAIDPNLIVQIPLDAEVEQISYLEAVRFAIREEMHHDESVFIMGEDIAQHGGAFGVTRTLIDDFGPERVINTPISENSMIGAGIGAAMSGMRPIVEIMFVDFSTLAMDQIINHAAKIPYMTGGQTKIPLVIRMPQGGGAGKAIAAQHSQSLEVLFAHIPGLTVVHPSTAYDAKGLLKSAIRSNNPVVFLEHKLLYTFKGWVPKQEYTRELGRCDIKRKGKHLTIVANGYMVWLAMQAAQIMEAEGVEVEVIDVMTVAPLDRQTLVDSVRKTGRAIVINESHTSYNAACEWSQTIQEGAFDYLHAPIRRVAGRDTPVPYAFSLERGQWPELEDVMKAVRETMAY